MRFACITDIKYSQSGWKYEDNWDLKIADTPIFETIYTKEIAESEVFHCYCYVAANTEITLILHSISGNSRDVWANLHYISKKLVQSEDNGIKHAYDWMIVMRWESNTDIDMDLHAWLNAENKDICCTTYESNMANSYIIDDNNRIWLDIDYATGSHLDKDARESKPEIITILGKPCDTIRIFVQNYNKNPKGISYKPELKLKEPVTIEIFTKDINNNKVLKNKFSVAGTKFTSNNYDIDFCTIDLNTGVVTKCEGIDEDVF